MRTMREVEDEITALLNAGVAPDQEEADRRVAALGNEAIEVRAATGEKLPWVVENMLACQRLSERRNPCEAGGDHNYANDYENDETGKTASCTKCGAVLDNE